MRSTRARGSMGVWREGGEREQRSVQSRRRRSAATRWVCKPCSQPASNQQQWTAWWQGRETRGRQASEGGQGSALNISRPKLRLLKTLQAASDKPLAEVHEHLNKRNDEHCQHNRRASHGRGVGGRCGRLCCLCGLQGRGLAALSIGAGSVSIALQDGRGLARSTHPATTAAVAEQRKVSRTDETDPDRRRAISDKAATG